MPWYVIRKKRRTELLSWRTMPLNWFASKKKKKSTRLCILNQKQKKQLWPSDRETHLNPSHTLHHDKSIYQKKIQRAQ